MVALFDWICTGITTLLMFPPSLIVVIFAALYVCAVTTIRPKVAVEMIATSSMFVAFFWPMRRTKNIQKSVLKTLIIIFRRPACGAVLARKGLETFKAVLLRDLFAAAHPKVCVDFNKKRGCKSEDCGQLHICNNVFLGPCSPDCDKVGGVPILCVFVFCSDLVPFHSAFVVIPQ